MKTRILSLALAPILAVFYLSGCGGSGPAGAIDTSSVEAAFAQGTPGRTEVDKAATVIRAGDYASALSSLRNLASTPNLSPPQQDALKSLIAAVEARVVAPAPPPTH